MWGTWYKLATDIVLQNQESLRGGHRNSVCAVQALLLSLRFTEHTSLFASFNSSSFGNNSLAGSKNDMHPQPKPNEL